MTTQIKLDVNNSIEMTRKLYTPGNLKTEFSIINGLNKNHKKIRIEWSTALGCKVVFREIYRLIDTYYKALIKSERPVMDD